MRNDLSEEYIIGAKKSVRNVDVKIVTNDDKITYTTDDIISMSIARSITDSSFGIGFTQSDRLTFTVNASDKIPKNTRCTVYVKFGNSDFERLGRFYSDECTRDGSSVTVVAYDIMYRQTKKTVNFNGVPAKEVPKLTFPCTMQDMLDYICKYRGLTCDFKCQDFAVQKRPKKSDDTFYTVREILGFIAASHGCNAKIDNEGKLNFAPFSEAEYELSADDVIDIKIDDSEPFEITGVLFTGLTDPNEDGDASIYIDDVEGSEYDEDALGVIICNDPLASVEIANYVWNRIGGLSYYGGSIIQRGMGILECGDVITVGNLKYPADTEDYKLCITGINYSFSASDGFTETITSQADKSSETMSGSSVSASGGKREPTLMIANVAPPETGDFIVGDCWAIPGEDELCTLYVYIGSEGWELHEDKAKLDAVPTPADGSYLMAVPMSSALRCRCFIPKNLT